MTQHMTQAELAKWANVSRAEWSSSSRDTRGSNSIEHALMRCSRGGSGQPAYRPVARISYPTRAFQASCHPCSVRANRATGGPGAALSQMPKYSFE
jgi:hypothetical protein